MIPLFVQYPRLADRFPRVSLGEFPTPAEKLSGLCRRMGKDNLYIKRDDLTGSVYGGNKVRKLEFLLAHAQRCGTTRIITAGGAGSNHAMASALYAKQVGLKAVLMLFSQPNSSAVRQNLLMNLYNDAQVIHYESYQEYLEAITGLIERFKMLDGVHPYFIPLGGSSPVGATGYVNAGFELAMQVAQGDIPSPDHIYLALGTMGTAAGLLLGLKAAGLKARVHAVRVVHSFMADEEKSNLLFCQTNELLRSLDTSFPLCAIEPEDLTIHHEYFGERYGLFTRKSVDAAALLRESDGIILDGTYTGKAGAAFLDHAASYVDKGEILLFWNTKNSRPFPGEVLSGDYRRLPEPFHRYFIDPVQPLDQEFLT
ncbi:MAG: pyridoxal-phosphate dependent enzyme [Deltaproteobacteria bacterium]|nr:pyridoxal-phosphate dependent enzyme [Deltaproteobacteria bacterium]